MTKDLQGSSHHLKVVGGAYSKRLAVVVKPEMYSDMQITLKRNASSATAELLFHF